MATIRTAIELEDRLSGVLNNVLDTVSMTVSAIEKMNRNLDKPIEATYFDGIQDSIASTAVDLQNLSEKIQRVHDKAEAPIASVPAAAVQPVAAPIHWQSDSLKVFTSTGVERFQHEIQAATRQLNDLGYTQSVIVENARNARIFSPTAMTDISGLQGRIQSIRQYIEQIESKPLNLVSANESNELERLRTQLESIKGAQMELNSAVEAMDISEANRAYLQLSQTVGNTERYIRDNAEAQERFNQKIEGGTQGSDRLMQSIKGIAAAYVSVQSFGKVLNLSDELTQTTARLNLMNDKLQSTEDLQNMIFLSAQRSRGSYQLTADAVAKMGMQASQAFSSNRELIAFTELLNKQFVNAGTSAQGIDSVMLQLTQSMAAGRLQGEELNAVMDNASVIVQDIQRYLQEVGGIDASNIKELASEGVITADVIKNAMFYAADETNAKFESMPMTFEQVWTSFENQALMAFQPVLERLNELANDENFQLFVNNAVNALASVSIAVLNIINVIASVGNFVVQNWSSIAPVIKIIAVALGIAAAAWGVYKIAQMLANSAMYACPLFWVVAICLVLVAVIYGVVKAINDATGSSVSATEIICGSFMAILATVGNVLIGAYNLVIDVVASIYNFVADIANAIGTLFNDPLAGVVRIFISVADFILSILQALASAIDAVFGTSLADGVQGWRDGMNGWVDDTFGEAEKVMEKWDPEAIKLERIDTQSAFNMGAEFGTGIDDVFSGFDTTNLFNTDGIPGANDFSDLYQGVYNIDENTGSMADSLSVTDEELKYLRDIAGRETINRFTTAEITIEQTNNNNISSETDLDGIVDGITDAVTEAVLIVTEGVHA